MLDLSNLTSAVVDGKYRIERMLGRGGMGAVFLAVHTGTTRPVALKLIIPKYAQDPSFIERFRREARAAGRMRHPNVVDVTDFGVAEVDGSQVAYLVMEYLDGCSLEEALADDPVLPLDWVVDIVDQMCLAVGELHRRGIIHRDLKPSNVWLEPNLRGGVTVKLLDFGLAKLREQPAVAETALAASASAPASASDAPTVVPGAADEPDVDGDAPRVAGPAAPDVEASESEADLTRAGSIMGTPAYMAPEQCGGEPVGPAADIYSLGCIVYQMLAGSPVFAGKAAHLLTQHMFTEPEPLDRRNPAVPSRVAEVVMWALRKDATERPATAGLFAGALRAKSESALGLVRRGLVLALEHLPVFVGATAALLAPYFAVLAATLAVDGLRHGGVVGPDTAAFALRVLFVAELATLMLAAILTRGVSLLVIAQILLAPLKRVRVAFALEALRRLLWPSLQGVAAWALLFVVPTLLAIACARAAGALLASGERVEAVTLALAAVASAAVGFKYLCDTLQLAGVILAEGLGLRAALGRSRELARRMPADTRLVAAINVGLAALPIALGPELEALRETFAGAAATIVALAVYRLLVAAVVAVLVGVLYFKQREANAESVESLLGPQQPTARETSKWQQRLDLSLMSLRASGSQPDLPGADSGAERAG